MLFKICLIRQKIGGNTHMRKLNVVANISISETQFQI